MASTLPPLVLMHGLTMSGSAWQDTVPLLGVHHEVFTPSLLGHRGGPPARHHPVAIWDLIDEAERFLDDHGLDRPHLAGNSTGGFVALELARRGRAASVCAFSPGGLWTDELRAQLMKQLGRNTNLLRVTHRLNKLMFKQSTMRRVMMRPAAWHADRISAERAADIIDDGLGCTIVHEVQGTEAEQFVPMDPLPCPVTIAWAEHDMMLPLAIYEEIARDRLPGATFTILRDVGHVPMIDDPELVARTILELTHPDAIRET